MKTAENIESKASSNAAANRIEKQSRSFQTVDPVNQTKLVFDRAGINLEQEASPANEVVMSTTNPRLVHPVSNTSDKAEILRMKINAVTAKPWVQTQSGEEKIIQPNSDDFTSTKTFSDQTAAKIDSSKGLGSRLPDTAKSFMQSRFNSDFSNVRIHNDKDADLLTRELGAQAFTVGNDIYFNSGKYMPDSFSGRKLLAHELTHVLQQKSKVDNISGLIQRYDWGLHDVPGMAEEREDQCPEWTEATHEATGRLVAEIRARHSDDWNSCFSEIHSRRNRPENCCDLNYAAADHYFWLRLEVGSGNWSYAYAQAVIALGIVGRIILGERGPRTGACPMSPFSSVVTSWEYLGALRGRQDARRREEAEE